MQQLAINGTPVSAQQSNGGQTGSAGHQFLLSPANAPYPIYLHALAQLHNASGGQANSNMGQSGFEDVANGGSMMGSNGSGSSVQQGSGGQSGSQSGGSASSSGMGTGGLPMDPAEMYRLSQAQFAHYARNPAVAAAAVAGGPSK